MSRGKSAYVLISAIRRDGGTQIRAALDEATVSEYAAIIKVNGDKASTLPHVLVFFDGSVHWLVDGFHRIEGALRAGHRRIMAKVEPGSQRDAILAACGANAEHGLRRSNADKRRAVETLLADAEWREWPLRAIAKAAGVSHTFVSEVRDTINTQRSESVNVYNDEARRHEPTGLINREDAVRIGGGPHASIIGDEGAVVDPRPSHNRADSTTQAGATAPDEPAGPGPDEEAWFEEQRNPPRPCVDMHGLSAGIEWVRDVNALAAAVDAFDGHLRQAQAVLSVWVGTVQALKQGAHELAAMGRKAYRPKSACLYCKDPDGKAGRREGCNGCHGLGWMTEEQLGAVPRELVGSDKVIDQKRGGFVAAGPGPRKFYAQGYEEKPRRLRIQDDAGNELVTERDEDEDATGWG